MLYSGYEWRGSIDIGGVAMRQVLAASKGQAQALGKVRMLFLGRTLILNSHRDSTLAAAYLRADLAGNELWLEHVV